MRIKLAILFSILLLSAQYARQLSYMGCKILVPKNATCNCQGILVQKELSHEYAPLQHKHIHIDEYVQQNENCNLSANNIFFAQKHYPNYVVATLDVSKSKLFKPPVF
jgi:hypothetical protein